MGARSPSYNGASQGGRSKLIVSASSIPFWGIDSLNISRASRAVPGVGLAGRVGFIRLSYQEMAKLCDLSASRGVVRRICFVGFSLLSDLFAVGGRMESVVDDPSIDFEGLPGAGTERPSDQDCSDKRPMRNRDRVKSGRPQNSWYAIQVPTGQEEKICRAIRRVAAIVSFKSASHRASRRRRRSEASAVTSLLLPGYVIVVTSDVQALHNRLKDVNSFTKLLTFDGKFLPLNGSERAWIGAFTSSDDRTVPMSRAFMDGDRIVVFSGPLKGREAQIVSVNRRKSIACIELDMFGRRVKTRIGLGVMQRCQC